MKKIRAADLFCGAGGTSTGLALACREAGIEVDLLAINHWQIAIDTHSASHPWARHMCASVDHINPRDVVPGGRLHILCASPECTNHSIARGGRPINDQSRATAWQILKWAQELYIDNILIENVREFRDWGPIGANGKSLKSRKGETFRAFIASLQSLGYRVEHRILNAADYGDPTTRERLFIIARRGNKSIQWPGTTHSRDGGRELFGHKKPYRTAREIIDWAIPNPSIFTRKKPLAPTTMARIIAGIEKFNPQLEPFIVTLRQHVAPRGVDEPVPTVSAQGTHLGLCEPFVLQQQSGGAPRSTGEPLPTVATKGAIALAEPVLVKVTHGKQSDGRPQTLDKPLPTVTTHNGVGLAEPYLVPIDQQGSREAGTRSVDEPVPTITTKARMALAEPCIVKYYGTAKAATVDEPLDTVTTKDRFGLVQPEMNGYRLDIRFRMLQPHELASAQGFPNDYKFTGTKSDVVKQIGNAVPVHLAQALCASLLEDYAPKLKAIPAVHIEQSEARA
jgi:DNA (cytosine-5)-methyltransferase 1